MVAEPVSGTAAAAATAASISATPVVTTSAGSITVGNTLAAAAAAGGLALSMSGGSAAAAGIEAQSKQSEAQISAQIATEEANEAEESLFRVRRLREIIGSQEALRSAQNINPFSGSPARLVESSKAAAARETDIERFNAGTTTRALRSRSASNSAFASFNAGMARFKGFSSGVGSLFTAMS